MSESNSGGNIIQSSSGEIYYSKFKGEEVDTAVEAVLDNDCVIKYGNIIGNLSNQPDITNAINTKGDSLRIVQGKLELISSPLDGSSEKTLSSVEISNLGYTLQYENTILYLMDSDSIVQSSVEIDTVPKIDNKTITSNDNSQLQSVGLINVNDNYIYDNTVVNPTPSTSLKFWSGTLEQYNNIPVKDGSTVYNIVDDVSDENSSYTKLETYSKTEVNNIVKESKKDDLTNTVVDYPKIYLDSVYNEAMQTVTLYLRAGSAITFPAGFNSDDSKRIDTVVLTSDISLRITDMTYFATGCFLFVKRTGNNIDGYTYSMFNTDSMGSDSSAIINYKSDENLIYGSSNNSGYSFPIAFLMKSPKYDSSKNYGVAPNVANPKGTFDLRIKLYESVTYIGTYLCVRKDVKVLIPAGKNGDGSLKSIEATVDYPLMYNYGYGIDIDSDTIFLQRNTNGVGGEIGSLKITRLQTRLVKTVKNRTQFPPIYVPDGASQWAYFGFSEEDNYWYFSYNLDNIPFTPVQVVPIGIAKVRSNNYIANLEPREATKLVEYWDKGWIGQQSFPSGVSVDLTIRENGANYTAPANGWFVATVESPTGQSSNRFVAIVNRGGLISNSTFNSTGWGTHVTLPAKAGDIVSYYYDISNVVDVHSFRFVYAEGEIV